MQKKYNKQTLYITDLICHLQHNYYNKRDIV